MTRVIVKTKFNINDKIFVFKKTKQYSYELCFVRRDTLKIPYLLVFLLISREIKFKMLMIKSTINYQPKEFQINLNKHVEDHFK